MPALEAFLVVMLVLNLMWSAYAYSKKKYFEAIIAMLWVLTMIVTSVYVKITVLIGVLQ